MSGLLPFDKPTVTIWADESCLGNQNVGTARPGACAGLAQVELPFPNGLGLYTFKYSEPDTTNQRMALMSVIEPLRCIPKDIPVLFISDSRYVVDGCSSWLWTWVANGWRSSKGRVENQDLWQRVYDLLQDRKIRFQWVKGHNGDGNNERADRAANEAAAEQSCNVNQLEDSVLQAELYRMSRYTAAARADLGVPAPTPSRDEEHTAIVWMAKRLSQLDSRGIAPFPENMRWALAAAAMGDVEHLVALLAEAPLELTDVA